MGNGCQALGLARNFRYTRGEFVVTFQPTSSCRTDTCRGSQNLPESTDSREVSPSLRERSGTDEQRLRSTHDLRGEENLHRSNG